MSKKAKHQSIEKELKRNLLWLEKLDCITKVVIGISEACRHRYSPGVIRFRSDVDGGIKVNGYSGKGVTDIFLRLDPMSKREEIKAVIAERFS